MCFIVLIFILTFMPSQVSAKVQIHSEYHAPTDLFALMDGVSQWYFNDSSYHKEWVSRFGWSNKDKKLARIYRKYRSRTYHDPAQNRQKLKNKINGIFAAQSSYAITVDPLAEHFINSDTIEQALSSFNKISLNDDAAMLVNFYRHFQPKWELILDESSAFVTYAELLNKQFNGDLINSYLNRIGEFYGVKLDLTFKARFVWWPPIDRTLADISGHTIFLRLHPQKHLENGGWDEIVMHEFVHYVSAHQSNEKKQTLSQVFLDTCSFKSKKHYDYLEEPMAVAWGQAAFAKYVKGEPLDPSLSWYNRSMPEIMGRLIWLKVDAIYASKAILDESFVQFAAKNCANILKISSKH